MSAVDCHCITHIYGYKRLLLQVPTGIIISQYSWGGIKHTPRRAKQKTLNTEGLKSTIYAIYPKVVQSLFLSCQEFLSKQEERIILAEKRQKAWVGVGSHSLGDRRADKLNAACSSDIKGEAKVKSRTESRQTKQGCVRARTTEEETKDPDDAWVASWVLPFPNGNPVFSLYQKLLFSSAAEMLKDFAMFNRYFNRKVSEYFKYDKESAAKLLQIFLLKNQQLEHILFFPSVSLTHCLNCQGNCHFVIS